MVAFVFDWEDRGNFGFPDLFLKKSSGLTPLGTGFIHLKNAHDTGDPKTAIAGAAAEKPIASRILGAERIAGKILLNAS